MSMDANGADIELWAPSLNPSDDTSPVGGTIGAGPAINPATAGALIPSLALIPASGIDTHYYYAGCIKNVNLTTSNLNNPLFWLINGANPPPTSNNFQASSTDPNEVGLLVYSYMKSGVYVQETVSLAGTSLVSTTNAPDSGTEWGVVKWSLGGSNPSNATGDIVFLVNGVAVGFIPVGYDSLISFIQLGMDDAIGSTLQTSNRLTIPQISAVDMVFSRSNTELSAIATPASAALPHGNFVKLWFDVLLPAGMVIHQTAVKPKIGLSGQSSN